MVTAISLVFSTLATVGCLFALTKIFQRLVSFRRWWNKLDVFSCDPGVPILGNLLEFPGTNETGLAYQRELTRRFPRVLTFRALFFRDLVVHHPETVKVILKTSEPKGPTVYNLIRPWIGDGLLTSSSKKWSRNRRLLTPAFHFEILKNYIGIKNRCADDLLKKFSDASNDGSSLQVFKEVSMFTLDVILKCSMSYSTNCQVGGEIHPYVKNVNEISELLVTRFFQPWFAFDSIYFLTPNGRKMRKLCKYVHDVSDDIIQCRKQKLNSKKDSEKNQIKCMDFLDILLTARDDEGNGLTDQEIRDEVDTFLFEGHDTTASAISWALFSIAEHPEIQQKIQAEFDLKLGGRLTDDVMWDDLAELSYLTKVIKEALRMHTPVPFIQRVLTKDTEFDGKVVPKGTMISVMLYNTHHNADVWEDSLKFDPERFSAENIRKRDSFAFVPFSAGPRNCIGQTFAMDEIKLILARLLSVFSISLDPLHKVEKDESIVMRAKNDIKILVSKRDRHI